MFDIHIHVTDKKALGEIKETLDKIITLLEDRDIPGLDKVIEDISESTEKVKSIVQ